MRNDHNPNQLDPNNSILSGANLKRADLSGADLSEANLSGVRLNLIAYITQFILWNLFSGVVRLFVLSVVWLFWWRNKDQS